MKFGILRNVTYLSGHDLATKCLKCQQLLVSRSLHSSPTNWQAINLSHTSYKDKDPSSDTPLLVTHGLLGSKGNWNSIAKAVSKVTNREVIVFDGRNHGDSPKTEQHSYELMAQDILELAKSLGIEKFSLMGHSMGGRTAMVLALRYPQFLDKLIVVDVSPISMQAVFHLEMKNYLKTMMDINFDVGKPLMLSEARKIGNDALKSIVPEAGVRAFLLTNLAENNGKIYWKPNLPVLLKAVETVGEFPEDLLSKTFNNPTLFIRGVKSTYIPDSDIPGIKKLFPSAKFDTIQKAGHWPHADNVKDFLDSLLAFLKS